MKKCFILLFLFPICMKGQIYEYGLLFKDTLQYKNFNQGFIDSQIYFNGTQDFVFGLTSTIAYHIPTTINYFIYPRNSRLTNRLNVNNDYLFSDKDYYNGYRHGSMKKKKKRLIQGVLSPFVVLIFGLAQII